MGGGHSDALYFFGRNRGLDCVWTPRCHRRFSSPKASFFRPLDPPMLSNGWINPTLGSNTETDHSFKDLVKYQTCQTQRSLVSYKFITSCGIFIEFNISNLHLFIALSKPSRRSCRDWEPVSSLSSTNMKWVWFESSIRYPMVSVLESLIADVWNKWI